MHIERILLRDIGPFDDTTIELPKGGDPALADVYLLTGPNGSGKSTILYALAAVISGGREQLGLDLLARRMRSATAMAAVQTDTGESFTTVQRDHQSSAHPAAPPNPFGGPPLSEAASTVELTHFGPDGESRRYSRRAAKFLAHKVAGANLAFDWAAFAYAGVRPMSDINITAIQEPKTNPFENSLSFLQSTDTNLLANWIVNQDYRRLKAKDGGNSKRADQIADSVRSIEQIIAEIVGDPSFAFVITDRDVHVRWQGVTVHLGVLPDGLQSIVSWIADLLMRLDRIPWQGDLPVQERRFLLLLDEIDIHLHPAWQRKVLPLVQRVFPNAQIIASTHSPFVVGSLANGRIIELGLEGSTAFVRRGDTKPQLGVSCSSVLRSIFGIESEFDIDTERKLRQLQDARARLLTGDEAARTEVDLVAAELAQRSDELRELVARELARPRP